MSKWHKNKWQDKAQSLSSETASALRLVLDELNSGQRQKLKKSEKVAELFRRYGVMDDA